MFTVKVIKNHETTIYADRCVIIARPGAVSFSGAVDVAAKYQQAADEIHLDVDVGNGVVEPVVFTHRPDKEKNQLVAVIIHPAGDDEVGALMSYEYIYEGDEVCVIDQFGKTAETVGWVDSLDSVAASQGRIESKLDALLEVLSEEGSDGDEQPELDLDGNPIALGRNESELL